MVKTIELPDQDGKSESIRLLGLVGLKDETKKKRTMQMHEFQKFILGKGDARSILELCKPLKHRI